MNGFNFQKKNARIYFKKKISLEVPETHNKNANLASAALEVEGTPAESTAESSSTDILVDASMLLESLRLVESINCFREGCLILVPDANTCPLIVLQSVPNKPSCSNIINSFTFFGTRVLDMVKIKDAKGQTGSKKRDNVNEQASIKIQKATEIEIGKDTAIARSLPSQCKE